MEHEEISQLLRENQAALEENKNLLQQNNQILRKMHRSAIIGFWFRIVWVLVLLGLPFLIYWYILQPLLETLPFGESSTGWGLEIPFEQLQQYVDQLPQ